MDESRAKAIISKEDIEILVEMGMGAEGAKYWTCDFSHVRVLLVLNAIQAESIFLRNMLLSMVHTEAEVPLYIYHHGYRYHFCFSVCMPFSWKCQQFWPE